MHRDFLGENVVLVRWLDGCKVIFLSSTPQVLTYLPTWIICYYLSLIVHSIAEFRISYTLTGGSGSFEYGSAWNCIKIQNVKVRNLSTMLLMIGLFNFRDKNNKLGNSKRKQIFWFEASESLFTSNNPFCCRMYWKTELLILLILFLMKFLLVMLRYFFKGFFFKPYFC